MQSVARFAEELNRLMADSYDGCKSCGSGLLLPPARQGNVPAPLNPILGPMTERSLRTPLETFDSSGRYYFQTESLANEAV